MSYIIPIGNGSFESAKWVGWFCVSAVTHAWSHMLLPVDNGRIPGTRILNIYEM